MKTMYIFLTRTESIASKIVKLFTKTNYTHASLAFDKELVLLYSSARKNGVKMFPSGPTRESLNRGFFGRDPHTPCVLYSLEVTDDAYNKAKEEVGLFMENIDNYKFSILGVIACKFGIKWKRQNKYFCSQFVGEILTRSGAVDLPKEPCLMHPRDYEKLPEVKKLYEGTVGEIKKLIKEKEAITV